MKKLLLLAGLCALFAAPAASAQEVLEVTEIQEVPYVTDNTQGYLLNKFKDNWFITLQGGANVLFSHADKHLDFKDRIDGAANLYIGKWFTPVFGGRIGVEWVPMKGLGDKGSFGISSTTPESNGMYKTRWMEVGPTFDLMVNLTNLVCGYHPDRVYGLTVYGGAGGYWALVKKFDSKGKSEGYKDGNDRVLTVRAGIINSFNVSKRVALSLDLRASVLDGHHDFSGYSNRTYLDLQAYLGVTVKLGKTEWSAPVVPVCPPAENCDALRARLAAADARIADLEGQLRDCLNRPVQTIVEAQKAPLATIYYPIGVYRLTKEDNNVLGAIANVMKSNSNTHYVLTGWADNYTGTDAINVRLRHNRVNGVYDKLVKEGVPASQLTATINNGSLCDLGEKYVSLDRAVTIEEGK